MSVNSQLGTDHVQVTIKGVTYKMAPITLAILGQVEQALKNKHRREVAGQIEWLKSLDLDPDTYKATVREILSEKITDDTVQAYIETPAGVTDLIDLCLRKNHKDLPEDFVKELPHTELEVLTKAIQEQMTDSPGEAQDGEAAEGRKEGLAE